VLFRSRARGVKIAGADALVLSHEDFLLHLCLHGTRHLTRDWQDRTVLKSVCDIAHAVVAWRNEIDWQVVRRRALEWRARNAVFVMLYLANEWLAAPVPEQFLSSMRPADLTSDLLAWTRERILRSGIAVAEPVGDNVAQFVQASGIRAKAALIFREAFPTRDQMAVRYGVPPRPPGIYFRYPGHVAGLVVRGVTHGFGLLTRRGVPDDSARVVAHNVALRAWLQSPRS